MVSIPRTRDRGIILRALELPGNPQDRGTFEAALKEIKRIPGNEPGIFIADRGYQVKKELSKTQLLTPSAPLKSDSQYDQPRQRKRFRKRTGLEATISNLKQHYRMGKCYIKGELGDQINVTLAATAYNLRKWIRLRLDSFLTPNIKVLKNCFSHHIASANVFLRYTYSLMLQLVTHCAKKNVLIQCA